MFHYENDDYECAADPFCPPAFPISDETNDGEWDGYMPEADEIAGESDYMPGYDDGEWDDHESLCGEEDFA
jgi:hypothetical protein